MKAYELSKRYNIDRLLEMDKEIKEDPANKNTDKNSIYLYTKSARKKLDEIGWAIIFILKNDKRKTRNDKTNASLR